MKKKLLINGVESEIDLKQCNEKGLIFTYAGKDWSYSDCTDDALYSNENDGVNRRHNIFKAKHGSITYIASGTRSFKVEDAMLSGTRSSVAAGAMVSPMPGKILKLFKSVGDKVKAGESILVMEAMKMEHAIKAPHDGIIAKIDRQEGDQVDGGVVLVELEEET